MYNRKKVMKRIRKVLFIGATVFILALAMSICCFATEAGADSTGFGGALSDFVTLLVGGIKDIATGLASGVNEYAQGLFLEVNASGDVTGLSTFGGIVAIFGGVALAVGLTTLIFNWIRSIGN